MHDRSFFGSNTCKPGVTTVPQERAVSSSERLPVLDGLRAISILLVLATHMLPLGPKVLALNHTAGAMGMSLFFALSGFLIASVLIHNPDICEFMVKRLARIVPLAYAYALLVFTIVSYDPDAMLWTFTFLLNYFPQHMNKYNEHFWSLCVELQFYFAIAITILVAGKKGLWIVWPACLAVTGLRISEGAYTHIQTHLRVDEILAGACVATLYKQSWAGRAQFPNASIGLAALSWFVTASPYFGPAQYLRPYATALVLAAVLRLGKTRVADFLASRAMRYIAAVSYALYVVHPLTVQGWWNQGTIFERYVLKRPISFAMTFAAAHISTFYWERLWIWAGRQWIQRRRLRRSQSPA
jgi:peptidoglycan/LPS O-acetylase OafA/YrhL